jgi:hypothetical protein
MPPSLTTRAVKVEVDRYPGTKCSSDDVAVQTRELAGGKYSLLKGNY